MAPLKVALILYPAFDTLDLVGPLEVYTTRPNPPAEQLFTTRLFSSAPTKDPITSEGRASFVPDAPLTELEQSLDTYDILVVPGAHPDQLETFLASEDGKNVVGLVKRFAKLSPREDAKGVRVLQSVCSGAVILAAAGVFAGRKATTHHFCFEMMEEYAARAAKEEGSESAKVEVVRKRWVDGGKTSEGVRVISAGGVSSGIDASLWVVELVGGEKAYKYVEEVMEFERRGEGEGWGVEKA